jgi:hypothetical protein
MDQAHSLGLQVKPTGMIQQADQSSDRIDHKQFAAFFKSMSCCLKTLLQGGQNFVAGDGFLGMGINPAAVQRTIGRIHNYGIQGAGLEERGELLQIAPDDKDAILKAVEPDITGSQIR